MITVNGRSVTVPPEDREIGFEGDHNYKTVFIEVTAEGLEECEFKITTLQQSCGNIILPPVEWDEGTATLTWIISRDTTLKDGMLHAQIRAERGEQLVWHSEIFTLNIRQSINIGEALPSPLPNEFQEYERRIIEHIREAVEIGSEAEAAKNAAEAAAEASTAYASESSGYKDQAIAAKIAAEEARNTSAASAAESASYASDASGYKDQALAAKESAEAAQSAAADSAASSSAYSLSASDSATKAEKAKNRALNAEASAIGAADECDDALEAVTQLKTQTVAAKDAAVSAKEAAEEAQNTIESEIADLATKVYVDNAIIAAIGAAIGGAY